MKLFKTDCDKLMIKAKKLRLSNHEVFDECCRMAWYDPSELDTDKVKFTFIDKSELEFELNRLKSTGNEYVPNS